MDLGIEKADAEHPARVAVEFEAPRGAAERRARSLDLQQHFPPEQVANLCGYLVAMATGYVMHSKWSFRGHDAQASQTTWRFFIVSLVSYGMNSVFIWFFTDDAMLAGPWWWPLVPILFVTPLVTFSLNRFWVFG